MNKFNLSFSLNVVLLLSLIFFIMKFKSVTSSYNQLVLNYSNLVQNQADESNSVESEFIVKKGEVFPQLISTNTDGEKVLVPKYNATKKKLVVFSSRTCPNCEIYHPVLQEFSTNHEEVEVSVTQYDASPADIKKFLAETGYSFSMTSVENSVLDSLQVFYTPTTVILNEKNQVDTVLMVAQELRDLEMIFQKL